MRIRPPAVPLINIDPYFNVWSRGDSLNSVNTSHWTNKPNTIVGIVNIDGKEMCFMGNKSGTVNIKQTDLEVKAMNTYYTFEGMGIELNVNFFTPLFLDNLKILTRPITYCNVSYNNTDSIEHNVKITFCVADDICLDYKGEYPVTVEKLALKNNISAIKVGSKTQPVLKHCGDDLRIDWGYFYLAAENSNTFSTEFIGNTLVFIEKALTENENGLFLFGYDDVYSIDYYGDKLKSVWNNDGTTIEEAICDANEDFATLKVCAEKFEESLSKDAEEKGGYYYEELLNLAYRQAIAAHKTVVDKNGDLLFISKECFSGGFGSTADVTYPSIPLFLIYNPELVKGMLRPIFKYANKPEWTNDFAPHDAGFYPIISGQTYCTVEDISRQMPVEECGNMLITTVAVCLKENDFQFVVEEFELLKKWADYLVSNGVNPENQLCTDDFAGHLAHNCNLSIKAILGIAAFSIINEHLGDKQAADKYYKIAKDMANVWEENAKNADGTYRLAFDKEDTFSMKYNIIWDKFFGTHLFSDDVIKNEIRGYKKKMNSYGLPLDSRADYTKSDWLLWIASLTETKDEFIEFIKPLWNSYNETETRVPLTDWYDTITAKQVGFQNRTVQGGLFIRLLEL